MTAELLTPETLDGPASRPQSPEHALREVPAVRSILPAETRNSPTDGVVRIENFIISAFVVLAGSFLGLILAFFLGFAFGWIEISC